MDNSDKSLSVFIVSHDQNYILNAKHDTIPNLKYIFVGDGPFHLISTMKNVIIARNYEDNLEDQKYLLSFTAWYLIIKNRLCTTSHLVILEYDSIVHDSFFETTLNLLQKYDAISYAQWDEEVNLMSFGQEFEELNNEVIEYAKVQDFIYQRPWFNTTNQCMSLTVLADFVDWFYDIQKIAQLQDFLHVSWYHERFYSMFIAMKSIKHVFAENLVRHTYMESHALSGANSLTYFKWQLYNELHNDVKYNFGSTKKRARHHFIHQGQMERRALRIPDFNWRIYCMLYPKNCTDELSASLDYLKTLKSKEPANFSWQDYSVENNLSEKNIIRKDDVILQYLTQKLQITNMHFVILLTATVDEKTQEDYKAAVDFYVNTSFQVVIVENSGYNLSFLPDCDKLKKISFIRNATSINKECKERESINYAIENSKCLTSCTYIVQITGNQIVANITEIIDACKLNNILHNLPIDLTANQGDVKNSQVHIFNKETAPLLFTTTK